MLYSSAFYDIIPWLSSSSSKSCLSLGKNCGMEGTQGIIARKAAIRTSPGSPLSSRICTTNRIYSKYWSEYILTSKPNSIGKNIQFRIPEILLYCTCVCIHKEQNTQSLPSMRPQILDSQPSGNSAGLSLASQVSGLSSEAMQKMKPFLLQCQKSYLSLFTLSPQIRISCRWLKTAIVLVHCKPECSIMRLCHIKSFTDTKTKRKPCTENLILTIAATSALPCNNSE